MRQISEHVILSYDAVAKVDFSLFTIWKLGEIRALNLFLVEMDASAVPLEKPDGLGLGEPCRVGVIISVHFLVDILSVRLSQIVNS